MECSVFEYELFNNIIVLFTFLLLLFCWTILSLTTTATTVKALPPKFRLSLEPAYLSVLLSSTGNNKQIDTYYANKHSSLSRAINFQIWTICNSIKNIFPIMVCKCYIAKKSKVASVISDSNE